MTVAHKSKASSRASRPKSDQSSAGLAGSAKGSGWAGEERRSEGRFEALLFAISTRFIALSVDRIDGEIVSAQREICESLGLDISVLWQMAPGDPGTFLSTQIYVPPDYDVPVSEMDGQGFFPWTLARLVKGEKVALSRLTDIPPEGARDQEILRHFRIQSSICIPLSAGGAQIFGTVSFNTFRRQRTWTPDLIDKLELVAQVFANALFRKRADQELRENEARYRTLFEVAPAGIILVGLDGRVRTANALQARLYGYDSPRQLEGFFAPHFVAERDRERAAQNMKSILQGEELRERSYAAVRRDGSEFNVEVTSVALRGPQEEFQGYLCLTRDITKSQQDEREMTELRLERTHLARVLTVDEMSTSLAHEINQPLGAILNNAEAARILLSQGPEKSVTVPEIVEDIIRDARRAGDIVRKVRRVLKRSDAQFERLPVNGLIEETLQIMQNNLLLNDVTLLTELTPNLLDFWGDRVRLQQVLLNLMTNALDAMKGMPTRVLTLRSAMDGPDAVKVSVGDSGPGIAEPHRESVFEPFFTTKKGGLGLGLSICRSIIEEHEGRIWQASEPGGGTIFSFSLKARRDDSA